MLPEQGELQKAFRGSPHLTLRYKIGSLAMSISVAIQSPDTLDHLQ